LDIFRNNRFYASKFNELNDPMEGFFDYDKTITKQHRKDLLSEKQNRRICSFCKSFSSPLLWAHYADRFKGICIEIETDDSATYEKKNVTYSPFRPYLTHGQTNNLRELADIVLSCKNKAWKYEKEVRLLTREKYISNGFSICSIYFGLRTTEANKWLIKKIINNNVEVFDTMISPSTNLIKKSSVWDSNIT
jgi:hypothetical protein